VRISGPEKEFPSANTSQKAIKVLLMPCRTEYNQDLALLSMQVHASAQSKKCQKTRVRLPNLRDSAARSLSNQPPRRLGSAVDMLHDTLPPIRPPPFPPKERRFRGTGPGRERCVLTCSDAAGHIKLNADTPYILISGRCGGGRSSLLRDG
jgi:hypothetical protein